MDVSTVIGMVLSSTVIGALISGAFTRVSEKESNDITYWIGPTKKSNGWTIRWRKETGS